MGNKLINFLDGSKEEREKAMKDFFGLSEAQTFQDIQIDEEDSEDDGT